MPRARSTPCASSRASARRRSGARARRSARSTSVPPPDDIVARASRRGFLRRAAAALVAVAGASILAEERLPSDAQGAYYTFCGHTFTTASCPHPTGLPRIDAHGLPLRARDGHPVDDLGRPIDAEGRPLDHGGQLMLDPDGAPLALAPRSRLCEDAVAAAYDLHTQIDGSWHRCCGGQVRKLVDCCALTSKRINGDAALRGYCFHGRNVFCVMYYDTKVPC